MLYSNSKLILNLKHKKHKYTVTVAFDTLKSYIILFSLTVFLESGTKLKGGVETCREK